MLSIHKVFKAVALAAGIVVTAATANASTITQLFGIPSTSIPFLQNINYNLFDTNLGTLTSVTIRLQTTSLAEVDVYNNTGSDQPFTNATASFPLTVSGPPGITTYITDTITAGPINGTANGGPGVVETKFPGVTGTDDSGNVAIPNVDWALNFEQAGGGVAPATINVSAGNGSYAGSAPSGVFFGGSGALSGTFNTPPDGLVGVTLIYTYTAGTPGAPEPGTWALLIATGSVSVFGLRRRRALKA